MSEPPQPARPIHNLTDAEARAADAAAKQRSAELDGAPTGPKPIGAQLPLAAAVANGAVRVPRMLLQAADLPKFKRPSFEIRLWNSKMRAVAATRQPGDVQQPTLERFAGYVVALHSSARTIVQMSYEAIGRAIGVCEETARKAAKFWTEHPGVLDIANVMGWHKKIIGGQERTLQLREANVYVPRMPDELDVETEKAVPEMRPVARYHAQINRWVPWFGLVARPWGLNATPLAPRRLNPERHPAPA